MCDPPKTGACIMLFSVFICLFINVFICVLTYLLIYLLKH